MALPESYTEAEFAAYLHGELGDIAGLLGWTVAGGSYDEIINDTLIAYGESDIEAIAGDTAVVKLRRIGKYVAWSRAVEQLAGKYDYRENNEQYDLASLQKRAQVSLRQSERDVSQYGIGPNVIGVKRVIRTQEPYAYIDPELQVIP